MYYAGVGRDIFKILSESGDLGGVGLFLLGVALTAYVGFQLYKFYIQNKGGGEGKTNEGIVYDIKIKLDQIRRDLDRFDEDFDNVHKIEDSVNDIENNIEKIDEILFLVKELHSWHDKEDQRGRKIWYVQYTMKEIVNNVLEGVNGMMELIEKLVEDVEEIQEKQMENRKNED